MGLLRSRHEQLRGRLSVSARQLDHQHAPEKSILRFAKGDYRGDGVRALEGNQCRGSTIESCTKERLNLSDIEERATHRSLSPSEPSREAKPHASRSA